MGSSFHCPADRQPFMAIPEKWGRGKREKVSGVQGSLDPGRPVCGRGKGWQEEVWQRPGLEVPETALIVQSFVRAPAGFAPGAPEKLLLLGCLWVQLSQLLILHQLWEWRACLAPSRGSFPPGSHFPTEQEGSQNCTSQNTHRIVMITNSLFCLQEKVGQNY